jgi:hypothetical protein
LKLPKPVTVRTSLQRWAAQWYSRNRLTGVTQHFLFAGGLIPVLFRTRQEARAWIAEKYGYIAKRPDLQREPHGWRVPRAVKVRVSVEVAR